ncbi:MAG: TIM barrel protein [Candidatus Liptonbacteria bacterium]|nr:TIM barrel protein [Candidatus Liptonbacteria bacterium]
MTTETGLAPTPTNEVVPVVTRKFGDPWDIVIDEETLADRRRTLIESARKKLWDPREDGPNNKGVFTFGPELAQYGALSLGEALGFAKAIGSDVAQPSGNHIDLIQASADSEYRGGVLRAFDEADIPLLSVSIHCDTYAALAVRDDEKAKMFTPSRIQGFPADDTSNQHLQRLALMIQGAAELGIPALHLFWGAPKNLPAYKWPPITAEQIAAMREEFVRLVKPLQELAAKLGIKLCHEIHFGTIAMNADDFITIWEMLGKPDNFGAGFDPSHFWHGETWWQALDKLRKAGVKVFLAHAKNTSLFAGRAILGYQADDRLLGMSFASLDSPHGIVDFVQYGGMLTLSGIVEFWFGMGLPVPLYAEAENPFFRIEDVSRKAIEHLRHTLGGYRLPKGHFTDAMAKR